jgi:endonuclease/exonuclease/phosphatase family metal-dependent hydrolase
LPIFGQSEEQTAKIMFWNVENLFDVQDDPVKKDEEFTPKGNRRWTHSKYYRKLHNVYRVITAAGGWEPLPLIGLCEVEGRKVLNDLVYNTPLADDGYRIIHREGPDRRGIDVALLYVSDRFLPLTSDWIKISDTLDPDFITREILYVNGVLDERDTLHLFVNHWPSRFGGYTETANKRMRASKTLANEVTEILDEDSTANIIIMGDFNDGPDDPSMKLLSDTAPTGLENLFGELDNGYGTIKYRGQWSIFDQFLVTENLSESKAEIFRPEFLFIRDRTYTGKKPFRTYSGFRYEGGFSDHLPILLYLE